MLGDPIVLYRRADRTPVALEDRCVHRSLPAHAGLGSGTQLNETGWRLARLRARKK